MFGRLALASSRRWETRSYILLTYCVGLQPGDDIVRDILRYAPHLASHA